MRSRNLLSPFPAPCGPSVLETKAMWEILHSEYAVISLTPRRSEGQHAQERPRVFPVRPSVIQAPRRLCVVLSSDSGLLGNRAVPPLSRPVPPPTPSSSLPQPLYLGPLSGLLLAPHLPQSPSWTPSRGPGTAGDTGLPGGNISPQSPCVCGGAGLGGGLARPGLAHLVWWWDTDPLLTIPVPLGPWKVSGKWERMDVARTSPSSPLEREHLSKTQI